MAKKNPQKRAPKRLALESALFAIRDILHDPDRTKNDADVRLALALDDKQELVAKGGEAGKDREESPNPTKCPCGHHWSAKVDSKFYDDKPKQAEIEQCLEKLAWPENGQKCESPCVPVDEFKNELKYWQLWRNKETGKFEVFCSKRKQWHCEKVQP